MENKIILNVKRDRLYWSISSCIENNWIEKVDPMWHIAIPDISIPEQKKALEIRSIISEIALQVLLTIESYKEQ